MKTMVSMMAALVLVAGCATLSEEERTQARVQWETCIDAEAPGILDFMLSVSAIGAPLTPADVGEVIHEMAVEQCGAGHLDAQTRRRYLVAELVQLMLERSGETVEQETPDER